MELCHWNRDSMHKIMNKNEPDVTGHKEFKPHGINLNQPLTDQLTKHPAFAFTSRNWKEESGNYMSGASAGRRWSPTRGIPGSTDNDRTGIFPKAFHDRSMTLSGGFDKYRRSTPDLIKNGASFREIQLKSDTNEISSDVNSRLMKCTRNSTPSSVMDNESAWSSFMPKKNFDGDLGNTYLPPAILPTNSYLLDQKTQGGLYKIPGYPFLMLPLQRGSLYDASGSRSTTMLDHTSLSHQMQQSSIPSADCRQMPYLQTVSAGSVLSPYMLYSDGATTRRLEILWQHKYPHLPVPPVWMLYQYMDELLRDKSESHKGSVVVGSVPDIAGTPLDGKGTTGVLESRERDRFSKVSKKLQNDWKRKESATMEKHNWFRNDRDCKGQGKYKALRQGQGHVQGSEQSNLVQDQVHDQGSHHHQLRRDQLAHESSASSTRDAVNQHFKESLLRLAFQNGEKTKHSAKEVAGCVLSRSCLDDQVIIEKQENFHYSGKSDCWKDNTDNITDLSKIQHGRRGSHNAASRHLQSNPSKNITEATSKASNLQPDPYNLDLYGYQSRQELGQEPGRVNLKKGFTQKDSFSAKTTTSESFQILPSKRCSPNLPNRGHSHRAAHDSTECGRRSFTKDFYSEDRVSEPTASDKPTSYVMTKPICMGNQMVVSPLPGSVVKDFRNGPSCLVARSPRPLLTALGNAVDIDVEMVRHCQTNGSDNSAWNGRTAAVKDGCSVSYLAPISMASLLTGITRTDTQLQSSPISRALNATPVKQNLIPDHLHSSEYRDRSNSLPSSNHTLASELQRNPSHFNTFAPVDESSRTSVKRSSNKDADEQHVCLKRSRMNGADPQVLSSVEDNPRFRGVYLESFKSLIEKTVCHVYADNDDQRAENKQSGTFENRYPTANPEAAKLLQENRSCSASQVSLALEDSMTPSSEKLFQDMSIQLLPLSNGKSPPGVAQKSHVDSNTDKLIAEKKNNSLLISGNTISGSGLLHPLPSSLPPPASGASLHLKKAWLLRYSDADQKLASAPPSPMNNHSDCGLSDQCDRQSQPCPAVHSLSEVEKTEGNENLSTTASISCGKRCSQNLLSVTVGGPFGEEKQETKGNQHATIKSRKRKTSPEKITQSFKSTRGAVAEASNETRILNRRESHRIRTKYSTRLAKMNQRSETADRAQTPHFNHSDRTKSESGSNDDKDDDSSSNSSSSQDSEVASSPSDVENKKLSRLRKRKVINIHVTKAKTRVHSLTGQQDLKTTEHFLQDGSCTDVAPKLTKCRECKMSPRSKKTNHSTNICKFYQFRKLRYNDSGILTVAGFLEPSDAKADDVALWLSGPPNMPSLLTPNQAKYIINCLRHQFISLLDQGDCSISRDKSTPYPGKVLWRRPMEGVEETCDVCDMTLFDVHWTCTACGFVICVGCHEEHYVMTKDSGELQTEKRDGWPVCSAKRRNHEVNDLLITQTIPNDICKIMAARLHEVLDETDMTNKLTVADIPSQSSSHLTFSGVSPKSDERNCASDENLVQGSVLQTSMLDNAVAEAEHKRKNACDPLDHSEKENIRADDYRFDNHRVLHIVDDLDNIELFQMHWRQALPVVISNCDKRFQASLWNPEVFSKRFGRLRVSLVNCLTGSIHRYHSMEKFWNSSKHLLSSNRKAGVLRFRNWPLSDWDGSLNDHCRDLVHALPFPCYTLSTGQLNLLSHLPSVFPQPDFAAQINVGFGCIDENRMTLAKLQMNLMDCVNIIMYVKTKKEDGDKTNEAPAVTEVVKDSGERDDRRHWDTRAKSTAAIWHIYQPQETDKIKAFLEKVESESIEQRTRDNSLSSSSSTSSSMTGEDFSYYLDSLLRDRLLLECGVRGSEVLQSFGDAVFVPSMSFYQVKVIQDCISVSKEFVSPEHIQSSFSNQLQPNWHHISDNCEDETKLDQLQIKNLIYHTMKDCISTLTHNKDS